MTGDINEHGVANAKHLATARGLAARTTLQRVDAHRPLPFPDASFDAILSNDAMCHIDGRLAVLRDWHRLLRPGGRAAFTDALVLTGQVTHEEVAARSSIGFCYVFAPPGENERLLAEAGFTLIRVEDLTTGQQFSRNAMARRAVAAPRRARSRRKASRTSRDCSGF